MQKMRLTKKYLASAILLIGLCAVIFIQCEKRDFKSPYDPRGGTKASVPVNLTATTLSDTTIKLQWRYNGDVIGFKIERKDSSNGQFKQLAQIEKDSTSYIDTNLKTDLHYYYQVKAFTASSESFAETDINHIFPVPSELTAVQISDTLLTLSWKDNSSFETGFVIERKQGTDSTFNQIATAGANIKTFSDSQIKIDIPHFYRIKAFTPHNESDYSNENNLTPTFPAPTNLKVSQLTDTNAKVEWQDNSSFENGFKVERKEGTTGTFCEISTVSSNIMNYIDEGLQLGNSYFYRVKAFTIKNQSTHSNESGIMLVFPAPSNLTATQLTDIQVTLTWQDNSSFESGFIIERKEAINGIYAEVGSVKSNITTFIDESVQLGYGYLYRIKAITAINQSDYSNERAIYFTFLAPTLMAPMQLSDIRVKLTWQNNSNFAKGFRIERKESVGDWKQIIQLVGSNYTNYTDENTSLNKIYTYRILAFTEKNISPYSNEVTLKTIFPAPTNLVINSISSISLQLIWQDNCIFEEGYRIKIVKDGQTDTMAIELPANSTSYQINYLDRKITYFVQILAYKYLNTSQSLVGRFHNVPSFQCIKVITGTIGKTSVDFSRDGKWLATGLDNYSRFSVYETSNWSRIQTLYQEQKPGVIQSVSFSPDGKWLACGGSNSTTIWNTNDWSKNQILTDNSNDNWLMDCSVAFSPDGKWFVNSNRYGTIKIWSTGNWDNVKTISGVHGDVWAAVQSVVFSPDGQWLASAGNYRDYTSNIWSTDDWSKIVSLTSEQDHINSLAFSSNGLWLARAGEHWQFEIWSTSSWSIVQTLSGHTWGISSVAFSHNNQWLASGSRYETIIWSINSWSKIFTLTGHSSYVNSVAFSPDDEYLVSASADGSLRIWQTTLWQLK